MRWDGQLVDGIGTDEGPVLPGMPDVPGRIRVVRPPEFAGVTFHEVAASSALNRVPAASQVPFDWTVNPYRGCTHGCVYCFARGTHSYLEFDTGHDFDTQIVVKVNIAEVLRRETVPALLATRSRGAGYQHRPLPARRGPLSADAGHCRRVGRQRHAVFDPHQGHGARP